MRKLHAVHLFHDGSSFFAHDNEKAQKEKHIGLSIKKRVLAIDYGTKRIGLAQSDPLGLFAQPVGTFDRERLFETLEKLFDEGDVEKVIVGYPLNEKGEKNPMTDVVDRFIEDLLKAFPFVEVETRNEHASSAEARRILISSGTSKKKRQEKGRLDSAAACVLLTGYLESRR